MKTLVQNLSLKAGQGLRNLSLKLGKSLKHWTIPWFQLYATWTVVLLTCHEHKNDLTDVWRSAISKRLLFTFFH